MARVSYILEADEIHIILKAAEECETHHRALVSCLFQFVVPDQLGAP